MESSQSLIRIVGLSATLPNYVDVARFLRVNPYVGLFYFDEGFRPVPLAQSFVAVKAVNRFEQLSQMDRACFEIVCGVNDVAWCDGWSGAGQCAEGVPGDDICACAQRHGDHSRADA